MGYFKNLEIDYEIDPEFSQPSDTIIGPMFTDIESEVCAKFTLHTLDKEPRDIIIYKGAIVNITYVDSNNVGKLVSKVGRVSKIAGKLSRNVNSSINIDGIFLDISTENNSEEIYVEVSKIRDLFY